MEKDRTEGHGDNVQVKSSFSAHSKREGSRVLPEKGYMIAVHRNDTMLLAKTLCPPESTNKIL